MARKNARSADNSRLFLFDTRTKAVMAHPQQDASLIKEKVQSVREVVPGRSNNEIVLVLQYYDNDVTQAIQAFLEDGAKEALQEWRHQAGSKPTNKKKKKNKHKANKTDANTGSQGDLNLVTMETESTTQSADTLTNHVAGSLTNHVADTLTNQVGPDSKSIATTTGNENLVNGHDPSVEPRVTSSHKSRSQPANHDPSRSGSGSRSRSGVKDTRSDSPRPPPRGPKSKPSALSISSGSSGSSEKPDSRPTPVVASKTQSSHSNQRRTPATTQAKSTAAKSTTAAPMANTGARSSDGSSRPRTLEVIRAGTRDRTTSEASTSSVSTSATEKRKPHAGLEKSVKDLLRQTLSLQRLKTTLNDEVDRSFKNISRVFEELRKHLNDREAETMYKLDTVKTQANDILVSRQKRAAELKLATDRSPTMSDEELAELRANIKHFVSERKLDEDTGSTQRFSCDLEHMLNEVKNFGEVVPVKIAYSQRRSSISSLGSSIVSHDDLQSPFTPLSQTNPFSPSSSLSQAQLAQSSSAARVVGQSESLTRYEVNELQNRLTGQPLKEKKPLKASAAPSKPVAKPAQTAAPNRGPRDQAAPNRGSSSGPANRGPSNPPANRGTANPPSSRGPSNTSSNRGPSSASSNRGPANAHSNKGPATATSNGPSNAPSTTPSHAPSLTPEEREAAREEQKKSRNARRRQRQRERQKEQRRSEPRDSQSEEPADDQGKGKGQAEEKGQGKGQPQDRGQPGGQSDERGQTRNERNRRYRRTPSPQKQTQVNQAPGAPQGKGQGSQQGKGQGSQKVNGPRSQAVKQEANKEQGVVKMESGENKSPEVEITADRPKTPTEAPKPEAPQICETPETKAPTSIEAPKEEAPEEAVTTEDLDKEVPAVEAPTREGSSMEPLATDTVTTEGSCTEAPITQEVAQDVEPAQVPTGQSIPNEDLPTEAETDIHEESTDTKEVVVDDAIAIETPSNDQASSPAVSPTTPRRSAAKSNGKAVTVSVKNDLDPPHVPKTAEVSALDDISCHNNHDKVDVNSNSRINGSTVSEESDPLPQRKPRSRGNRRPENGLTNGNHSNHVIPNGDISNHIVQ